jgi:hypothetical protein
MLQNYLLSFVQKCTLLHKSMHCRQRCHLLYIMGLKIWNTIWPPPRSSPFIGGQRWQSI